MVRIIVQGRPPAPRPDWWLVVEHRCARCGTVYQLEAGDPVTVVTERSVDGFSRATSRCPVCEGPVVSALRNNTLSAPPLDPQLIRRSAVPPIPAGSQP